MTFRFRVRLDMHAEGGLPPDSELVLEEAPHRVLLAVGSNTDLAARRRMSLHGSGYASEEEATASGEAWIDAFRAGSTMMHLHPDFGFNHPAAGGLTEAGKRSFASASGTHVENDRPGVIVTSEDKQVGYFGVSLRAAVPFDDASLAARVAEFRTVAPLPPGVRLACDLLATIENTEAPDVQLLLSVTVIEALAEVQERDAKQLALIDSFAAQLEESALTGASLHSLRGSLKSLRNESIGSACRRFVSTIGGSFNGKSPGVFFRECYTLRSRLTHGGTVEAATISAVRTDMHRLAYEAVRKALLDLK